MNKFNSKYHKTIEESFITLNSLAERSDLNEGPESVRLGLLAFWRFPDENTQNIAEFTGLPVPGISSLRKELIKFGLFKNLREFSESGINFAKNSLKFSNIKGLPFYYKDNARQSIYADLITEKFLGDLEKVLKKRPHPNPELDQSRLNFKSVVRRIKVLLAHGDLEGRRICFLGDDDGISTSLALFKKYNPQFNFSVSVIDIDDLVIKFIKKTDINKEINFLKCDLRNECISDEWLNRFDVILTDPPYTINGAGLFLRTAYALLHQQFNNNESIILSKPVYFSFSNKSSFFNFKLLHLILNEHFSVDTIYKRFNFYSGKRLIHRFGNMWILRTLNKDTEKFNSEDLDFSKIYTWQILEGGKPRNKRIKNEN